MNLKTEILKYAANRSQMSFEDLAFEIYNLQSVNNVVYNRFLNILGKQEFTPSSIDDIPLLPISVFKHQLIKTYQWESESLFLSSGTGTNNQRSCHHVRDIQFYNQISASIFKSFYPEEEYEILALLPSYIENGNSSLVQMSSHLMSVYNGNNEGFYLYNFDELDAQLKLKSEKKKVLIGVTFALMDFAEKYKIKDANLSVVFTGGMKNRKREMTFDEVFLRLKESFPESSIDAEYGMTEMFSQSYTIDNAYGNYEQGRTIRIMPKQINDPLVFNKLGKAGQLGFIDIANIDTVSFVLTDDLCIQNYDQTFKLLGRMSESDLRGCTLLYEE